MSVFIAMLVGSEKSTLDLVKTSVESIIRNVGNQTYKLLIGVAPHIPPGIKDFLLRFSQGHIGSVDVIWSYGGTFAQFMNLAASMAHADGYDWFIESHDDVEILTPDFVGYAQGVVDKSTCPVGWISFLDKDYLNAQWAPSIREGFALDAIKENAWSRKKTHQFHNLPENWWSFNNTRQYLESLPYDIPNGPVKCHAPFSHFIMIRTSTLVNQIGSCPDWSPTSLLIDEDRGLKALACGLFNIWIPQIEYIHRRPGGTRAWELIRMYGPTAHSAFKSKWGFDHKSIYSDSEISEISRRYSGTNVCWSVGKRTYDWEYIL